MNIGIFLFLLFVSVEGSKYRIYKKTNGFDYRPDIQESPLQLQRIRKYFENKRLLDTLENPQIPLHVKVNLIQKPGITPSNLYAGGLMRDFCFDMEDPPPKLNNF